MSFEVKRRGAFDYLCYQPWLEQGIEHGFTLTPHDFSTPRLAESGAEFCQAFKVDRLLILKQVHGNQCIDLRDSGELEAICQKYENSGVHLLSPEADALLVQRGSATINTSIAVGIRVADCVPILIRSGDSFALIHAGWRGLTNGIIGRVIKNFLASQNQEGIEVVIGPCAGAERYEVDEDVINAIGRDGVWRRADTPSKYLLSLAESAKRTIEYEIDHIKSICSSDVCSITDTRFHSYRRDGERSGRTLCFLRIS